MGPWRVLHVPAHLLTCHGRARAPVCKLGPRHRHAVCALSTKARPRASGLLSLLSSALYADYRKSIHDTAWSKHEPLIDIRPEMHFEQGHRRGATSIPLDQLQRRMFELPPPYESSVSLYGSPSDMKTAATLLRKYGWNITRLVDCTCAEEAEDEGDTWEQGLRSRPVWRPSAFLEEILSTPHVQEWAHASLNCDSSSSSSEGVKHALDIGCGAGRDMVLMARLLGPSWRVTGLDNDTGARERAEALAHLEGVHRQMQTVDINLRKESLSMSAHLVHGCRFLDRRLLPRIRDEILEPNGLFVWSTFLQGSPRVRNGRSLEPGELRRLFVEDLPASEAFEVVADTEGELFTGGSYIPASFFAAFKPPA